MRPKEKKNSIAQQYTKWAEIRGLHSWDRADSLPQKKSKSEVFENCFENRFHYRPLSRLLLHTI